MEFAISQGHQLLIDLTLDPFSFDRLEVFPTGDSTKPFSSALDNTAWAGDVLKKFQD